MFGFLARSVDAPIKAITSIFNTNFIIIILFFAPR